jgi:DNA-binding NarL/FixJ family response regulator
LDKPGKIRVVIAEDHDLVRRGFISLLRECPRIEVVSEAANGKELVEVLKHVNADIVITDLEMPVMNGDEAFNIIKQRFPGVKVIILSMHYEQTLLTGFLSKGVAAYLGKGCNEEELESAICAVYDTGHYFNHNSSLAMCNQLKNQSSFAAFNKISLTEREIEILRLLCDDMTNKEIGERLSIEPRTVDFHRQNIYKKTNCKKPAGLAIYAVNNGLLSARV